ncbi:MAG TPA: MOSC domain-containing protein [Acidimicrobiales bacterium]|nr:MOSC domain-containing protein [Acidimicrobiales bacterium]
MSAPESVFGPVSGQLGLLSVNVAKPAYLGMHRGKPVTSGIAKRPVEADELWVDRTNLEGDGQAELDVHGGVDKAVYAYASENLVTWGEELGQELGPAAFGENLTTIGWTEDDVRVGDRWLWGDAVLEVCQPRWPCYKLAMYRGRSDLGRRMRRNGRTGWYLRVLEPGRVPVAGPVRVERNPVPASVRLLHEAASPKSDVPADVIEALIGLDAVADEWRLMLADRLARV